MLTPQSFVAFDGQKASQHMPDFHLTGAALDMLEQMNQTSSRNASCPNASFDPGSMHARTKVHLTLQNLNRLNCHAVPPCLATLHGGTHTYTYQYIK